MTAYVDLMRENNIPSSSHQPLDERVWIAINRIERAELHEPLRESELALLAGVSKSHLNRMFVINTGKTPADYWADRRIHAARSALTESSRSVKTIAYELGFSSLSHFSTWVRKKTGMSPRTLRRSPLKVKRRPASELAPLSPHIAAARTQTKRSR
ncbi:MAG: AraC family transcriptional regulator, partial [Rariglobus sp.]